MILKRLCLFAGMAVLFGFSLCAENTRSKRRALRSAGDNTEIIEKIRGKQEKLYARSKKRSLSHSQPETKSFVFDKILARVNGVNILLSDLEIPRILKEGGFYSLEELITEELFVQRAVEQHFLPSDLDVERQIVAFKMQNGLTDISDVDFENQLKQSGFSLKSYKEQLSRLIAAENVKRSEVGDKLIVTSQEVEEYYKKNPEFIKEAYNLKIANIAKTDIPEKDYKWEDLGWIKKADLDERFDFVTSMEKSEVSQPIKFGDSYQVVKVVDKVMPRKKTLQECYRAIEKKILQKQQGTYLQNVEKDIRAKASIVYL